MKPKESAKIAAKIVACSLVLLALGLSVLGFQSVNNFPLRSKGAITAGHCASWVDARTAQDSGAVCGAGTSGVTAAGTLTSGNIVTGAGAKAVQDSGVAITAAQGVLFTAQCYGTVGTGNATSYAIQGGTSNSCANSTSILGTERISGVTCTLRNLYVHASVGATAGSGVVSMVKAGVSTGITCTLGTSATCSDTTHTVAMVPTDTYQFRVLTNQASDTTGNISISAQCN